MKTHIFKITSYLIRYRILVSILFIFLPRSTAAQIETAFVEKAVLKLSLGPISINRLFFSDDAFSLKYEVPFLTLLLKVGDNIHLSFSSSSLSSFPVVK